MSAPPERARRMAPKEAVATLDPAYFALVMATGIVSIGVRGMGATAITVLAGAQIVRMVDTPMVAAIRGVIIGASVAFWAFGTWLIPPLLAAGWWRHVARRVPLRYDASLWSIVFPLCRRCSAGKGKKKGSRK